MNKTEKIMKATIAVGFANKYYTLWRIWLIEEQKFFGTVTRTYYEYVQNLSYSREEAIKKARKHLKPHQSTVKVDTSLRGKTQSWYSSDSIEYREDIMLFGKYQKQDFETVLENDLDYLLWYYNATKNTEKFSEILEDLLVVKGYLKTYKGELMTRDEYEKAIEQEKLDSMIKGHFYEEKERLDLTLTLMKHFTFNGYYGLVDVQIFKDEFNREFTYLGTSPVDINQGDSAVITGTISHDEYREKPQTKIKRVKMKTSLQEVDMK